MMQYEYPTNLLKEAICVIPEQGLEERQKWLLLANLVECRKKPYYVKSFGQDDG